MAVTSSLAAQLHRLALPQTSVLLEDKRRASLLFDPKDAAKVGRDEAFLLGRSGFMELLSLNPRTFKRFEETLFSEASKFYERAVQTKQANSELDQTIHSFLIALSPYFLLKPAHRAMEWLIYRFHIHLYNVDSLLACILPHHDTKIFVRACQLINTRQHPHLIWLSGFQREGIPIPGKTIADRCLRDPDFLKVITNSLRDHIRRYGDSPKALDCCVTFFASAILGALRNLEEEDIPNHFVSQLVPALVEGVEAARIPNYQAAALLILAEMAHKQTMEKLFLEQVFVSLGKAVRDDSGAKAPFQALLLLCQLQTPATLPPALVSSLLDHSKPNRILQELLSGTDSQAFFQALTASVLLLENDEVLGESLVDLVRETSLSPREASAVAEMLLSTQKNFPWRERALNLIKNRFPQVYDALSEKEDVAWKEDVIVQLKHPNPKLRLKAVRRLKHVPGDVGMKVLNHLLIHLRSEDDPDVVLETLESFPSLLEIPESDGFIERFLKETADAWIPVQSRILQTATRALPFPLLLPFLFPFSSQRIHLLLAINHNAAISLPGNLRQELNEMALSEEECLPEVLRRILGFFVAAPSSLLEMDPSPLSISLQLLVEATRVLEQGGEGDKLIALTRCIQFPTAKPMDKEKLESLPPDGKVEQWLVPLLPSFFQSCHNRRIPPELFVLAVKALPKTSASTGTQEILTYCVNKYLAEPKLGWFWQQMLTDLILSAEDGGPNLNLLLSSLTLERSSEVQHVLCRMLSSAVDAVPKDDLFLSFFFAVVFRVQWSPSCKREMLQEILRVGGRHFPRLSPCVKYLLRTGDLNAIAEMPDHLSSCLLSFSESSTKTEEFFEVCLDIIRSESSVLVKEDVLKALQLISRVDLLEASFQEYSLRREQGAKDLSEINKLILDRFLLEPLSHFCNASSSKKKTEKDFYSLFKNHLLLEDLLASEYLLQRMPASFITALSPLNLEEEFLGFLFDNLPFETGKLPRVALKTVSRICKHLPLTGDFIRGRFLKIVPSLAEGEGIRKKRVSVSAVLTNQASSAEWKEIVFLLEIVEGKKKFNNSRVLVRPLFRLLERILNWSEQEKCEYQKQLLLSCLQRCLSDVEANDEVVEDLPVELIVLSLRTSDTWAVHQHALRLLALVAQLAPQATISSIVPVFTFMGSSLLRQDDVFSFQLTQETIRAVVPILKASCPEARSLTVSLLRVVVDAVLDIPSHRRHPILVQLVQALSPPPTLWILLALLLETQARKQSEHPKEYSDVALQLVATQTEDLSFDQRLEAAQELLQWLVSLPLEVPEKAAPSMEDDVEDLESCIVDLKSLDAKFLRQLQFQTLSLVLKLFSHPNFQAELKDVLEETENRVHLESLMMSTLKLLLAWAHGISKSIKSHMRRSSDQRDETSGSVSATQQKKFLTAFLQRIYEVVHHICLSLPVSVFLETARGLLEDEADVVIQRKTLELLNTRILSLMSEAPKGNDHWDQACLALLPALRKSMFLTKRVTKEAAEIASTPFEGDRFLLDCRLAVAQGSLFTVKLLAKRYAEGHAEAFAVMIPDVCKLVKRAFSYECLPLLSSSVLTLAQLAAELKLHAPASLEVLMPTLLSTLQNSEDILRDPLLLISCVTALLRVVETLPTFMVPYLSDILLILPRLPQSATDQDKPQRVTAIQKVHKVVRVLGVSLEARVLVPVLSECCATHALSLPEDEMRRAVSVYMTLLSIHIQQISKREVHHNLDTLSDLFIRVISQRGAPAAEEPVLKAILAFVLKLNEETFTVVLLKLVEWAFLTVSPPDDAPSSRKKRRKEEMEDDPSKERRGKERSKERQRRAAIFFTFMHQISEELGSLLLPFVHHFYEHATEALDEGAQNLQVLRPLLSTLRHLFQLEAVDRDRFDVVMPPLIKLFEATSIQAGSEMEFGTLNSAFLIPTLSSLATSLPQTLAKELLMALLAETKHEAKEVRLGMLNALNVIVSNLATLSGQWLPEILPFLSELLEDDIPEVENAAQEILALLGKTTGENVQEYL